MADRTDSVTAQDRLFPAITSAWGDPIRIVWVSRGMGWTGIDNGCGERRVRRHDLFDQAASDDSAVAPRQRLCIQAWLTQPAWAWATVAAKSAK